MFEQKQSTNPLKKIQILWVVETDDFIVQKGLFAI